ncbi:MAG: Ribonuclease P protein component [Acidobacteria bacterium ADurb.Bin340]|nr:MAG: Ribonuclease P protein component [Acidobacteria bacterium ADurb.Bin340]
MEFAGRFRAARQGDHVVPECPPRPLSDRASGLDIRIWARPGATLPLLLVNASRKQGRAVHRNLFRRRVRMAFLAVLRSTPEFAPFSGVLWVRPARGVQGGCNLPYAEIEAHLSAALRRWMAR